MRIIRIAVILLVLLVVVSPRLALADETSSAETNIDPTLLYFSNILAPNVAQADDEILAAAQPKEAQQAPEEIQNQEIIDKWRDKQADQWNNLPGKPFEVNASEYTASADECGNSRGITASGVKVGENRTIACPPELPFGVKIKIDGMGTFVCEDRGGAIKGNHIDIYVKTKKEAFAFGRQDLMAQVVE